MQEKVAREIDGLYRSTYGKLLASLVSFFNLSNIQLAEDIVQETFISAHTNWTTNGIPNQPEAWLFKACKNKAINALNKKDNQLYRHFDVSSIRGGYPELETAFSPSEIKNNRLYLLFAACHPLFSSKARIILTLKTLIGFKTEEIARALHMKNEAVKKVLSRTKNTIKDRNLPLKIPFLAQSKERLTSVHQILYLIFNEGYSAHSGDLLIKKELCLEALRLTSSLIHETRIADDHTHALYALLLLNTSRFDARTDAASDIIELEHQDRSLWDKELINAGIHHFNRSRKSEQWSVYHYEAAIASLHCTAPHFGKTNWNGIIKLYQKLQQINNSPFLELNKNIALFYSGEAALALENIERLSGLETSHLYHAALGKMYAATASAEKALNAYLDALKYTHIGPERRFLEKKIQELDAY